MKGAARNERRTPQALKMNLTEQKRKKGSSDDRMSRVDDITDNLREKHGHMYSNLQYRVWAETIVGGRHASYFKKSKNSTIT